MSGNNERVTGSRTKPISSSQPPLKRTTPTAGTTRETLTQPKITRITPRPTENPWERDHPDANNAREDAAGNNLNNHQQHTTSAPTTNPNPTNAINEQGTNPNNTTDGNDGREANANPNPNPNCRPGHRPWPLTPWQGLPGRRPWPLTPWQSLPGHRPWLLTAINRVSGQGRCPGRLCHGVSGQGRCPG